MKKLIIRQGDVILEKLEKGNYGDLRWTGSDTLELRGETGQVHTLQKVEVYAPVKRNIFENVVFVKEETALTHPEHPAIMVPEGTYGVRRLRYYVAPRRARLVRD